MANLLITAAVYYLNSQRYSSLIFSNCRLLFFTQWSDLFLIESERKDLTVAFPVFMIQYVSFILGSLSFIETLTFRYLQKLLGLWLVHILLHLVVYGMALSMVPKLGLLVFRYSLQTSVNGKAKKLLMKLHPSSRSKWKNLMFLMSWVMVVILLIWGHLIQMYRRRAVKSLNKNWFDARSLVLRF